MFCVDIQSYLQTKVVYCPRSPSTTYNKKMSRRPTKATASSSSNAATFSTGYERPPISSHLDLSSANDDDTAGKIHKKSKQQPRQKGGSSILIAIVSGIIALGTLYYIANKFSYMTKHHVNSSLSIHHGGGEKKIENEEPNNDHHHHSHLQLPPDSIYRTKITDIHDTPQSLLQYAGSISLIINVACE